jgi:hypothetical protein
MKGHRKQLPTTGEMHRAQDFRSRLTMVDQLRRQLYGSMPDLCQLTYQLQIAHLVPTTCPLGITPCTHLRAFRTRNMVLLGSAWRKNPFHSGSNTMIENHLLSLVRTGQERPRVSITEPRYLISTIPTFPSCHPSIKMTPAQAASCLLLCFTIS